MTSHRTRTVPFESAITDLAEAFLGLHYPDETAYVPVVLRAIRARPSPEPRSAGDSVANLGLPFAAANAVGLVAPYVIVTLEAVFRELAALGGTPDLDTVRDVVRGAAEAFGASPRLVGELASDLPPKLLDVFQGGPLELPPAEATKSPPVIGAASSCPAGKLWIELMAPGTVGVHGEWRSVDEALSSVSRLDCDLTVDEPNGTMWSWHDRKRTPRSLGKIGPNLRVFLWMMLTRVGHTFTFLQIHQLLGERGIKKLNHHHRHRVYQYRKRLANILGTGVPGQRLQRNRGACENDHCDGRLIGRVLRDGGPMTYFVPKADWSLCWIRREKDATCSLLVGHLDAKLLAPPKNQ